MPVIPELDRDCQSRAAGGNLVPGQGSLLPAGPSELAGLGREAGGQVATVSLGTFQRQRRQAGVGVEQPAECDHRRRWGALFGRFEREIRPAFADEGAVNCDNREGAPTAVYRPHEIIDVTIGVGEAQLRPFP